MQLFAGSPSSYRRVKRQMQIILGKTNSSGKNFYQSHHPDSPCRAQFSFRKFTALSVSVTALLSSLFLLSVFSTALPTLTLRTTIASARAIDADSIPSAPFLSPSSSFTISGLLRLCDWFSICPPNESQHSSPQNSSRPLSALSIDEGKKKSVQPALTETRGDESAHKCFLVAHEGQTDKLELPFNSRTFCLSGPTCVAHGRLYGANESRSECRVVDSSLARTIERPLNCSWLQKTVRCSQGLIHDVHREECPVHSTLDEAPESAEWIDGALIVIPAYPHLRNIYHYAHALGAAAHIAASLPSLSYSSMSGLRKVVIVFRGLDPRQLGDWQQFMMQGVLFRLNKLGLEARVHSLGQELPPVASVPKGQPLCSKQVALLGKRSDVNVWPFPTTDLVTGLDIARTARLVPVESIAWRAASYALSGVSSRLPLVPGGAHDAPKTAWSDLPPLVIGYARRQTPGDPSSPDDIVPSGMTRRLSDADETWLISLLSEEARQVGASFSTVETHNGTDVAEQVRVFASLGVVVGLHGANLLNAMFMPPFSALVEISNVLIPCYRAGANSGLASWTILASHIASMEESNCGSSHEKCKQSLLARRVMIDKDDDRRQITEAVRDAVGHIVKIRNAFQHLGAVPLVWEENKSSYSIDWSKKRR